MTEDWLTIDSGKIGVQIYQPTYQCPVHGEIMDVVTFHTGGKLPRRYCACCLEALIQQFLQPVLRSK